MSILLAIAEPTISIAIRKLLVEQGLDVIEDEVLHRKYLDEKIQLTSPSTVIIHDYFLPSELEDQEEKDLEILQMIEHWRTVYDSKLRIVYLCIRERNDPFLGQLVARNVLDIFHEKNLRTKEFAKQLSEPPRYVNVQKFGTGSLEIKFVDDEEPVEEETEEDNLLIEQSDESESKSSLLERAAKISSQVAEGAKRGAEGLKEKIPKRDPSEKPKTKEKKEPTVEDADDIMMEDILDLMPEELIQPKHIKPAIIGTVLIAVAGVKPHLGTTHTALTMASYLKNLGHSVAVVEVNYSQDFDRIHSLYEGEKEFLVYSETFDLFGVTHFKYRDEIDLNELYSAFEYVIMDYGSLEDAAAYEEEFRRAHVRCVLCSADEWKFHWVQDFLKINQLIKEDCVFVVPFATKPKLKDLQERLDYLDIYAMPIQDSPYEPIKESEEVLQDILGPYLKSPQRSFSRKELIATSVVSVALTALLIAIFIFLG